MTLAHFSGKRCMASSCGFGSLSCLPLRCCCALLLTTVKGRMAFKYITSAHFSGFLMRVRLLLMTGYFAFEALDMCLRNLHQLLQLCSPVYGALSSQLVSAHKEQHYTIMHSPLQGSLSSSPSPTGVLERETCT